MRKIAFLLFFIVTLFASNMEYELKIYKTLLDNIFPQKESIRVWSDCSKKKRLLTNLANVKIVNEINDADILIANKQKDLPKNKIIFTTNYLILKNTSTLELIGQTFYF